MWPDDCMALLPDCLTLIQRAGAVIVPYWRACASLRVRHKIDKTPVTEADLAAHHILAEGLQSLEPMLPILSEEGNILPYQQRQYWSHYWLIDPLDGTRGFLEGIQEFSINIALIAEHTPILGIIYAPVTQVCYYAVTGRGAFKQVPGQARQTLPSVQPVTPPWRIAVGEFHNFSDLQQHLPDYWQYTLLRLNSSLKFCALAEQRADIYVRLGPTCEWDTAAGQCILQEVGGATIDLAGKALQYNCKASLLNPNFIALADIGFLDQWLTILNNDLNKGELS